MHGLTLPPCRPVAVVVGLFGVLPAPAIVVVAGLEVVGNALDVPF